MVSLAFYTWKKHWVGKHIQAARSTVILMIFAAMWLFLFIFQIIIQNPSYRYLLEQGMYFGPILIGPTWLILSLQWTGRDKKLTKRKIVFLYSVPLLFFFLVVTNDLHGLIFTKVNFFTQNSFLIMQLEYGELWWFLTFYTYVLILIGVFLLVRGFIILRHVYRKQAAILLTGTLTPLIINVLYNIYLNNFIYFDFTPLSFVVTGMVYYWGFSRFKLIEIVPIARDAVFEDMQDLVFVLDAQNRVVDANPILLKTFNLEESRVIGEKFEDVFLNQKEIIRNLNKGNDLKAEVMVKVNDKKLFYDMQINSLSDNHGNLSGRLVSLRDITDRKKMEEELRELNEELEQKVKERTAEIEKLLKQKDDFIWQLSHDLKSPLTPLVGLISVFEDEVKDPRQKQLVSVMRRNIDYMKNLVSKTLEFEKLGSPKVKPDFQEVKPFEVINDIVLSKEYVSKDKKIRIENNVDKKLVVNADQLQFRELFDNLITNAIKFVSEDGLIKIDAKTGKDSVVFSVSDNGIGMTKKQIEHVFDEFYKVDSSRHELGSTGLGLPICKRIVEKHGGRIWAESPGKGKGSTFFVEIPFNLK